MYEKLPQELKERGMFCLWKYEERDDCLTKVPYKINGFKGDSTNRATFTDFNTAASHRSGYDGIGIGVFDDICAIDIDHCVENGVLSDMAEDIIARMDTYTEYSPSGTGVRISYKDKYLIAMNVKKVSTKEFMRNAIIYLKKSGKLYYHLKQFTVIYTLYFRGYNNPYSRSVL